MPTDLGANKYGKGKLDKNNLCLTEVLFRASNIFIQDIML